MEKILFEGPTYIDYNWLMYALRNYASPRAKVTALLRKGELVRIKKGLYMPGRMFRRDWSRKVLANRIYGPSYVSFESALSWHGLIPERVENPTSASLRKARRFATPVGEFDYKRVPRRVFHCGLDLAREGEANFLIATPEKALADTVAREDDVSVVQDIDFLLTRSLRIERFHLQALNRGRLAAISAIYGNKSVTILQRYIQQTGKGTHE